MLAVTCCEFAGCRGCRESRLTRDYYEARPGRRKGSSRSEEMRKNSYSGNRVGVDRFTDTLGSGLSPRLSGGDGVRARDD